MNYFKKFSVALFVLPLSIMAQDLDVKVPFDPNVKTGVLPNGLTYFIRKNAKPEKKVDLRLVIKAGSILETDQQQGLAHFMEHMCFNGTKRFPKNKLVDYLQSIGVKFGQHLNAYTSFDETVYFLPIPADSPEKIENGFNILEDWAFNTTLSPEEIDKERGVVLEEYRLGLGADKRMMGRFMPKMMYNSQYAHRLPIGQKEILENFTYDKLTSFYKDWYRPNLMAVIVVGDIDVNEMEKKIKDHFSSYKNPKNEKPRSQFEVPNHKETFVAIESDKEASSSDVQLLYKDLDTPKKRITEKDLKKAIVESLFTSMINARLDEYANGNKPPFLYGYSYHGETFAQTKNAYQSMAMTEDNKQLEALKVLVDENNRVKKFGFKQGELDRAKAEVLAWKDKQYKEKDKQNSEMYVNELQSHFLSGNLLPGIEWSYEFYSKFIPTITLADVNAEISKLIREENRVVILTSPEKESIKKITESEVLSVLNNDASTIKDYEDKAVAASLLRNPIKEGSIINKSTIDKIGVKTFELSNGAVVKYKKTDFKNEEILFEAVSFGGSNLYSNEDFKKVNWANGGLTEAGFSGLKTNDVTKFMTGKIANVSPYISGLTEGLRGSSTPKDFEYMLQMMYAYFTDLNYDAEAFEAYKQKQNSMFANIASQPNFYFSQEFYSYLNQDNPRFLGLVPMEKDWTYTDYKLAYEKYKERFANAGDFEFYFVGNIDETQFENLIKKYIASLPATKSKETYKDLGYRVRKGEVKKVVNKGTDPKSNVNIMIFGETSYNADEVLPMQFLGEILNIKLTEKLREAESGVYTVRSSGSVSKVPYGSFNFNVSFPCGPDNAEKLIQSTLQEMEKLVANGPEEKDLLKVKETNLLDYKKNSKENRYWMSNFTKAFTNSGNLEDILKYEENVNAVTAKQIQEVAKKYLTKEKKIGVLMPEEKK
ncbi:M16 family metallopeptidase [Flavobacterium urocaniciphilum]|uniref:Zinc protease n=1 Tax=Flavobacterium urocaniciphilum TaxID=1299341 RepID=A0A1H9AKJ1_9FLAO|nr:insulinase family protein [Flavobacterium urocaniciphilum]SEP77332.1 zinc protease [Flavobacterium urocaniciphilum]